MWARLPHSLIRGEAVGHEPGFPGARRGQYQERAIEMAEDICLLWVGIAHGIGVMRVSRAIPNNRLRRVASWQAVGFNPASFRPAVLELV